MRRMAGVYHGIAARHQQAGDGYEAVLRCIDGFHRWTLSLRSERLKGKYNGDVPCCLLNTDLPEAMLMTVRINRAKGLIAQFFWLKHRAVDKMCTEFGVTDCNSVV